MKIYLWKGKSNQHVVFHTSLEMAKEEGYTTKPELTIEEEEWYENDCTAYIDGDKIVLGKSPEEKADEEAFKKRMERDRKLAETDKYMILDFPITEECKEEMIIYRQALRDLPANDNWPYVDLPEEPDVTKEKEETLAKKLKMERLAKSTKEEVKEEEPATEEAK